MNARQSRRERRAAEREAVKLSRESESNEVSVPANAIVTDQARSSLTEARPKQAATGPRTPEGKNRSKRNSFKHGLYAKDLVLPGESADELNCLRETLRANHQPVNETEEILVNEIAEHFWRLRRMRQFEARGMQPENLDGWLESGLLALVARNMASAERGLHKAIAALRRLQLDRGFVPSKIMEAVLEEPEPIEPREADSPANEHPHGGFVPSFRGEFLAEVNEDLQFFGMQHVSGLSRDPFTPDSAALL